MGQTHSHFDSRLFRSSRRSSSLSSLPTSSYYGKRRDKLAIKVTKKTGTVMVDEGNHPDLTVVEIIELCNVLNAVPYCRFPRLWLRAKKIDDAGCEALMSFLQTNITMKKMNISYNHITDVGARFISEALSKNNTLLYLDLSENSIGSQGIKEIMRGISRKNCVLHTLVLSGNEISGGEGAKSIAKALMKNTSLTELFLGWTSLEDEGIQRIMTAMLSCEYSLKGLSLYNNYISEQGCVAIAEMLSYDTALTYLDLSDNPDIGREGMRKICDSLQNNIHLKRLNVSQINLDETDDIAEMLCHNNTLTELNLSQNRINDAGMDIISKSLETNKTLQTLNLLLNMVGDASAKGIATMLHENNSLKQLNLSGNKIREEGAEVFIKVLAKNTKVDICLVRNEGIPKNKHEVINVLSKRNQRLRDERGTRVGKVLPDVQLSVAVNNAQLGFNLNYSSLTHEQTITFERENSLVAQHKMKHNRRTRIAVVGHAGAGKTTLISHLLHQSITQTKPTEVVEVTEHQIHQIKVDIWDFGGHESYNSTHPIFLSGTENAFYLLVWNARTETWNTIQEWINLLSSLYSSRMGSEAKGVQVVLVATHLDEVRDREKEVREKLKHYKSEHSKHRVQIKEYFLVENKGNKRGIKELDEYIKEEMNNKQGEYHAEPRIYSKILKMIQNNAKGDNMSICDKSQVIETIDRQLRDKKQPGLVEEVIQYYHCLGIMLNFQPRNDSTSPIATTTIINLNQILIPDAGIMIKIIRSLINSQNRKVQNGIISTNDLAAQWKQLFGMSKCEVDKTKAVLLSLGLLFPLLKPGDVTVKFNVIPLRLNLSEPGDEYSEQELFLKQNNNNNNQNNSKILIRSIKTNEMIIDGIIGKCIAHLWEHVTVFWRAGAVFIKYDHNGEETIVRMWIAQQAKNTIQIVAKGKDRLEMICKVTDAVDLLLSENFNHYYQYSNCKALPSGETSFNDTITTPTNSMTVTIIQNQLRTKIIEYKSWCGECYKRGESHCWNRSAIDTRIINGKWKVSCDDCDSSDITVFDLGWKIGALYSAYLLNDKARHKSGLTRQDVLGNFKYFPMQDFATFEQMQRLLHLTQQNKLKMKDFTWLKRLGSGAEGIVYLCKYNSSNPNPNSNSNSSNPNKHFGGFLCAIKVSNSWGGNNNRHLLLAKLESEVSIQSTLSSSLLPGKLSNVSRILTYFVDELIPDLPDWDVETIKPRTLVQNIVMDVFDSNFLKFFTHSSSHLVKKHKNRPHHTTSHFQDFQDKNHFKIVILQILKSLEELGKAKIVHGDVKKENILISKSSMYAVLSDFGTAKNLKHTDFMWSTEDGWGSPSGIPPELRKFIEKNLQMEKNVTSGGF